MSIGLVAGAMLVIGLGAGGRKAEAQSCSVTAYVICPGPFETPDATIVNQPFAHAIVAHVQNLGGPVAGQNVTFTVPSSGPSLNTTTRTVVTDVNGDAVLANPPSANSIAGTYQVTATTPNATNNPVVYTLTNVLYTSQNAGASTVGGAATTVTLTYTFNQVKFGPLTIATKYGMEFTAGPLSCTGSDAQQNQICTSTLSFAARSPGLKQDAALVKDSTGAFIAMTYVYGAGQGAQAVFSPTAFTTYATGLNQPAGLNFDGAGNLFFADTNANRVYKVPAGGGVATDFADDIKNGLLKPTSVAVDGAGNVFIATLVNGGGQDGQVFIIPVTGFPCGAGCPSFNDNGAPLFGVAIEGTGTVLIAGQSALLEQPLTSFPRSLYPSSVQDVAVDAGGNVFAVSLASSSVLKLVPGNTTPVLIGSGLHQPYVVRVDAGGNLYVVDGDGAGLPGSRLLMISPAGVTTVLQSNTQAPYANGVALDGAGNLFVSEVSDVHSTSASNTGTVREYVRTAASLTFASQTLGSTSAAQDVTLTNIGNQALAVSSLQTSANFDTGGANTTCTGTGSLAGGASCVLGIRFRPVAVGTFTGTSTVTDNSLNASAATQVVSLSGTATAALKDISATVSLDPVGPVTTSSGATVMAHVNGNATTGTPTGGNFIYSIDGGTPQTSSAVTGGANNQASAALTIPTGLSVGTHTLTANYSGDTLYAAPATGASETFQVTAATTPVLTITANDATRVYGAPNPVFSGTVTGAVNGDTFTESFATTANSASAVGMYDIVPSATGPHLSTYTQVIRNGKLTISKAPTVSTVTSSSNLTAVGQSVTLTAVVASTTTGTPTGTITFLNNGVVLGTTSLDSNGQAILSTTTLGVGNNGITVQYSGDGNFLPSSGTGTVSITVGSPDFSFVLTSAPSFTGLYGSTAKYTFRATPGSGTFPAGVTFTLAGDLPVGATITLAPASVPAGSGAVDVALVVQTRKLSQSTAPPDLFSRVAPFSLCLLLLPLAAGRRLRRSGKLYRAMLPVLLLLSLAGVAGLSGCGSGVPMHDFPLVVTAKSGSVQHSVTVHFINLKQ